MRYYLSQVYVMGENQVEEKMGRRRRIKEGEEKVEDEREKEEEEKVEDREFRRK